MGGFQTILLGSTKALRESIVGGQAVLPDQRLGPDVAGPPTPFEVVERWIVRDYVSSPL